MKIVWNATGLAMASIPAAAWGSAAAQASVLHGCITVVDPANVAGSTARKKAWPAIAVARPCTPPGA